MDNSSIMSRAYPYAMLKIYTAHTLKNMGVPNAKVRVLNILTDALQDYILAMGKDKKLLDDHFCRNIPDVIHIIYLLKGFGINMNELMEYCLLINLQRITKDTGLVAENSPSNDVSKKRQKTGENDDEGDSSEEEEDYRETTSVKDFLELEQVRAMAIKDFEKMFNIPFTTA